MTPPLSASDIETIERATLDALPPLELVEDDGWLLTANGGAIGRANSVAPIQGGTGRLDRKIDRAMEFYRCRGLKPAFRLSDHSAPQGLAQALAGRGLAPEEPTLVMTADLAGVTRRLGGLAAADAVAAPGADWQALFLGPGVDPVKGRLRAQTLARGRSAIFAQVEADGRIAAVGAAAVRADWGGIHGMRTLAEFRRRGLARRVLARLISEATVQGATRGFLQVETGNSAAIALYQGLGFIPAWTYAYWR